MRVLYDKANSQVNTKNHKFAELYTNCKLKTTNTLLRIDIMITGVYSTFNLLQCAIKLPTQFVGPQVMKKRIIYTFSTAVRCNAPTHRQTGIIERAYHNFYFHEFCTTAKPRGQGWCK